MAQINIRVEEKLKEDSTKILNELGMDITGAIKIFFKQVVLQEGIPFDVTLKRPEIIQALEDIEKGKVKQFDNISSLMEELNNENWTNRNL